MRKGARYVLVIRCYKEKEGTVKKWVKKRGGAGNAAFEWLELPAEEARDAAKSLLAYAEAITAAESLREFAKKVDAYP